MEEAPFVPPGVSIPTTTYVYFRACGGVRGAAGSETWKRKCEALRAGI